MPWTNTCSASWWYSFNCCLFKKPSFPLALLIKVNGILTKTPSVSVEADKRTQYLQYPPPCEGEYASHLYSSSHDFWNVSGMVLPCKLSHFICGKDWWFVSVLLWHIYTSFHLAERKMIPGLWQQSQYHNHPHVQTSDHPKLEHWDIAKEQN